MNIELNGKQLVPRELTLREKEIVLEDLRDHEPHELEAEIPDRPVSALAIALSVYGRPAKKDDLPEVRQLLDELRDLTPSQVQQLAGEVVKVNPSVARSIDELGALAAKFMAVDQGDRNESQISAEQSTVSGDQPAG